MAWDDIEPGGGYTWTPSSGNQQGFARRIDPGTREAAEANRTRMGGRYSLPWESQFTGGRSRTDAPNWAASHPSTLDLQEAGRIRNINQATGINTLMDEDEKRGFFGDLAQLGRNITPDDAATMVGDIGGSFVHPGLEMLGKAGDLVKGAMRGSRLHSDYKDRSVAEGGTKAQGSRNWEADKRSMMTDKERAFEKKYLNLAAMAQDNQTRDEHLATAEQAWRNKQTSDRLAAASGFEGYRPDKYTDPSSIGYDRMQQISEGAWGGAGDAPGIADYSDPDEYLGGMYSGNPFADPDEYLGGMFPENGAVIKPKPDFPFFPEDYNYPDEKYGAPLRNVGGDPYYVDPEFDLMEGEQLVQTKPNPRGMNRSQIMFPRDTFAIEQMGGGFNALPLEGYEEEDLIQNPRGRLGLYGKR